MRQDSDDSDRLLPLWMTISVGAFMGYQADSVAEGIFLTFATLSLVFFVNYLAVRLDVGA